jgi:hypothetical protein
VAKQQTITKTIIEEEVERNGDPMALAIKSFLIDDGPLPEEELGKYEFSIKVTKLDRRGKAVHGIAFQTQTLLSLFEDIIDEFPGGGRFTIWCKYRVAGKEGPWQFLKATDVEVEDADSPAPLLGQPSVTDPGERRDILSVMISMLTAQQKSSNDLLIALLARPQAAPGGGTKEILEAVRIGLDAAGGGGGADDDNPGDMTTALVNAYSKTIDLLAGKKDTDLVPAGDVRKTLPPGVDTAITEQGFERK